MLVAGRSSWHAGVYRWWYAQKYNLKFTNDTTNLCPYVRAILIWAPLRFLFNPRYKLFGIKVNFVTTPLAYFAIAKYLGYLTYTGKFIMFGLAIIGVCVSALVLIICWIENSKFPEKVGDKIGESKFTQLVSAYSRSIHDGICPPIEFK